MCRHSLIRVGIICAVEVMRMRVAVVGGDRRSVLLCSMLARDGHRVHCFALEKAELPGEIPKAGCLQGCVYGADCVILPVPAEKGGLLNAPFAMLPLPMEELLNSLWPGQVLCGGKFSDETCAKTIRAEVHTEDIMRRPDFAVFNAAVTAEGALELLIKNSEKTLWKSRVLIVGWGRIGSILAHRLAALGAQVSITARHRADRAEADVFGFNALDYSELEKEIGNFDYIVNTVPARVISDAAVCCIGEGTVLMELASPPGGFDRTLAENIGVRVVSAPGLPGRCAPYTAAEIIKRAVYDIMAEQEE